MQHRSTIVVIVGGVIVLGLLFGLQRWLASTTEPIAGEPEASEPTEPGEPPPVTAPAGEPAPRSATIPQIPVEAPTARAPDRAPTLAPTAETGPEPGSPENTTNLHFGKRALREQVVAIRPQLVECAQRAAQAGERSTGTAALTFIVAMQGDKAVVETTGYDHDATTLTQPALIECLHEAARAMTFEGLPREARAISVTHRVEVADGELGANQLTDFSYIR